ncbi:MAG: DUF1501 domain-containing protein [Lentisphaeraceae bacterium]|nr:DUF1501 domain-containing protein [Lentisphaeraceae bacterium]
MKDISFDVNRRSLIKSAAGFSLGAIALNSLNAADNKPKRNENGGIEGLPHFKGKAKRVIYLTQSGGPTQHELFDYKPELAKWEGKVIPESIRKGQRVTGMTKNQKQIAMGSRTKFNRYSKCDIEIGEWIPHIGSVADEICLIKSMKSDQINHAPAMTRMLTGHQLPGRPSMGAWASYGLGSENKNLPDYVALVSKMERPSDQPLYEYYWGSGFLPSQYQGVKLRSAKEPVLYLNDPKGMSKKVRRKMLDTLAKMNQKHLEKSGDSEIETRIKQYEMAFRMQTSVPELTDLSDEPDHVFDMYGPDARRPGSYAANCILARRLAERNVRFIQLFHPDWDHHSRLAAWCPARCRDTDQPTAALIKDLKQRGLLEDTLIIWGGEFGRSPVGQGNFKSPEAGRDHHPSAFSIFMAGAGLKKGYSYGQTDEFGFHVAENPVHTQDLHATVLHALGIRHDRLSYRYQGLDMKLTGVEHAKVIKDLFA